MAWGNAAREKSRKLGVQMQLRSAFEIYRRSLSICNSFRISFRIRRKALKYPLFYEDPSAALLAGQHGRVRNSRDDFSRGGDALNMP